MGFRNEKVRAALLHAAQEYVNRESNRTSLITVTRVEMSDDAVAHIFVSVFPPESTGSAIYFLTRSIPEFVDFYKKSIRIRNVPHITFLADPEMGAVEGGPTT